uniref:Tc1-like transposase DDE domain-containing protein n=1 Tax=Seriola dumerili TaxID=41447 RepID=A0A3B4U8C2_SERDU
MPMPKEISLEIRKKIVEAHDKGEGYTAISKHFTVSRTAVRCIIAKYKETNYVRNKPGRGRKYKIPKTLERKIVKDVSKNPRSSAKMIVADLASSGVDVSRSTVVRALHRGGLHGHRPRRTPLLKERHIKARLRFALLEAVLWSDETKLELFGHMDVAYHHAVGLFCSLRHREPCSGAWHHEKRKLCRHFEDNMQKSARSLSLGRRWVFQQDNDPKHTSKLVQQFLKDTKIKVLEWPAQSPDLNPIEYLWKVLKVTVHARKPCNLDQLEQFAMEEWAKIPQETCANLVKTTLRERAKYWEE